MSDTSERVDRLENMMAEVAHAQMRTEMSLLSLSKEMSEFKDEMRGFKDDVAAFKDEMLGFKDEMRAYKDDTAVFKAEMLSFKDEMSVFKDEMHAFKNEMRTFKEEAERDRRRMNKAWGDLANKLGTTVEDVVAPNIPRIAARNSAWANEPICSCGRDA